MHNVQILFNITAVGPAAVLSCMDAVIRGPANKGIATPPSRPYRSAQTVKGIDMALQGRKGTFGFGKSSVHNVVIFLVVNNYHIIIAVPDKGLGFIVHLAVIRQNEIIDVSSAENNSHA